MASEEIPVKYFIPKGSTAIRPRKSAPTQSNSGYDFGEVVRCRLTRSDSGNERSAFCKFCEIILGSKVTAV